MIYPGEIQTQTMITNIFGIFLQPWTLAVQPSMQSANMAKGENSIQKGIEVKGIDDKTMPINVSVYASMNQLQEGPSCTLPIFPMIYSKEIQEQTMISNIFGMCSQYHPSDIKNYI